MSPLEKILRKHFEFEDTFDEEKFGLAVKDILALIPKDEALLPTREGQCEEALALIAQSNDCIVSNNITLANVRRAMGGEGK